MKEVNSLGTRVRVSYILSLKVHLKSCFNNVDSKAWSSVWVLNTLSLQAHSLNSKGPRACTRVQILWACECAALKDWVRINQMTHSPEWMFKQLARGQFESLQLAAGNANNLTDDINASRENNFSLIVTDHVP